MCDRRRPRGDGGGAAREYSFPLLRVSAASPPRTRRRHGDGDRDSDGEGACYLFFPSFLGHAHIWHLLLLKFINTIPRHGSEIMQLLAQWDWSHYAFILLMEMEMEVNIDTHVFAELGHSVSVKLWFAMSPIPTRHGESSSIHHTAFFYTSLCLASCNAQFIYPRACFERP